jgi:hypothetical protein
MSKNIPTNKALYSRVKSEAKKKFARWPSAYGSAWLVKEYKKRGGGYRKAEMGMEVDEYGQGGMLYGDQVYMYGGEDTDMEEYAKGGGIPQRYKNKGFTKVGAKKKSTRPGKKWMVLAKKGDKYKVVHGGYKGMKDFSQHGSAKRKKNFWDRMGGKDSAKAKDPFSPLYWHKRFGTWAEGGEFESHMMYDPNTGKGYMAEKMEDHLEMKEMGYLHEDEMQEMMRGGERYAKGGTNNPGFEALPPQVQQQILDNMGIGGECYACGGQKKYQYAGEFSTEFPTMLEEVEVTADNLYNGLQPKTIPNFTDETQGAQLMPLNLVNPNTLDSSIESEYRKLGANENEFGKDLQRKPMPNFRPQSPDLSLAPVFEPEPTQEDNSEDSGMSKMDWAMTRVAGASMINDVFDNLAARKRQAQQRQNLLSDNFIPMNTGNNRGDFDINTGIFRPDSYVPTQYKAQFEQGGQMGMVDEETLRALIAAGADIELLD